MMINKKLFATLSLLVAVAVMAMAPAKQEEKNPPAFKNLKVLPKNITKQQLDVVMEEWEHALGARCSLCHARNEETKKMDWASDAKPEKDMARHMYKMMNSINKKYFEAKKDSTGMMMTTGINCNSCHRGVSHPEVVPASGGPGRGPGAGGPPPAGNTPPAVAPPTGK